MQVIQTADAKAFFCPLKFSIDGAYGRQLPLLSCAGPKCMWWTYFTVDKSQGYCGHGGNHN